MILYVRGADGKLHPIPALVGPQGPAGADGATGPKGDSYTLTDSDLDTIAALVVEKLPKYNGEVV